MFAQNRRTSGIELEGDTVAVAVAVGNKRNCGRCRFLGRGSTAPRGYCSCHVAVAASGLLLLLLRGCCSRLASLVPTMANDDRWTRRAVEFVVWRGEGHDTASPPHPGLAVQEEMKVPPVTKPVPSPPTTTSCLTPQGRSRCWLCSFLLSSRKM